MQQSSYIRAGFYKSPWRVVAGMLLRSRDTQAKRAAQKSDQIRELKRAAQRQQRDVQTLQEERDHLKFQSAQLKVENQRLHQQPGLMHASFDWSLNCY